MIITENVIINEKQYVHTYSDSDMMIHGGYPESDYSETYDPVGSGRTYTETDIPVDGDVSAEVVDILMGVSE